MAGGWCDPRHQPLVESSRTTARIGPHALAAYGAICTTWRAGRSVRWWKEQLWRRSPHEGGGGAELHLEAGHERPAAEHAREGLETWRVVDGSWCRVGDHHLTTVQLTRVAGGGRCYAVWLPVLLMSSLGPQIQAHAALGLSFTCPLKNAWPAEACGMTYLRQANSCRRGFLQVAWPPALERSHHGICVGERATGTRGVSAVRLKPRDEAGGDEMGTSVGG